MSSGQLDSGLIVLFGPMQYPPAFHEDPEPHKGAKIVFLTTRRSKRSPTEDDHAELRRTEVSVPYPGEKVEVPVSQILEDLNEDWNLGEVEVEVMSYYKDTISMSSQIYKVNHNVFQGKNFF